MQDVMGFYDESRVTIGALKPEAGHMGGGHVEPQELRLAVFSNAEVALIRPSND